MHFFPIQSHQYLDSQWPQGLSDLPQCKSLFCSTHILRNQQDLSILQMWLLIPSSPCWTAWWAPESVNTTATANPTSCESTCYAFPKGHLYLTLHLSRLCCPFWASVSIRGFFLQTPEAGSDIIKGNSCLFLQKHLNCALFISPRKCSFFKQQVIHSLILCCGILMFSCFLNTEWKNLRMGPTAMGDCCGRTVEILNRSHQNRI